MSKSNTRLSVVRPALLGATLLLTFVMMTSPVKAAGCTPGAMRVIITSIVCCETGSVKVTKQRQICNSNGVWVNTGSSYCAPHNVCAT